MYLIGNTTKHDSCYSVFQTIIEGQRTEKPIAWTNQERLCKGGNIWAISWMMRLNKMGGRKPLYEFRIVCNNYRCILGDYERQLLIFRIIAINMYVWILLKGKVQGSDNFFH